MKERYMAETNTGETGLAPPNGEGQSLAQPQLDRGQNPSAEPNSEPNVLISPQAEKVPKEQPIELVKPDSGISPSVEAYRKMEADIALQERPVEIRGQMGGVLTESDKWINAAPWWPTELGPQKWIELSLEPLERAARGAFETIKYYRSLSYENWSKPDVRNNYLAACEILNEVAVKDQNAKTDTAISVLQKGLEDLDRSLVERFPVPEQREELYMLLDSYDSLKHEAGLLEGLGVNQPYDPKSLITETRWKKLNERLGEINPKIGSVEAEIKSRTVSTDPNFLQSRTNKQTEIAGEITRLTEVKRIENDRREGERKNEKDEREKTLEDDLAKEFDINTIPEFTRVKEIIGIERAKANTPGGVPNRFLLERAERQYQWYFHSARQNGLFADLEGDKSLDGRFRTYIALLQRENGGYLDALRQFTNDREAFNAIAAFIPPQLVRRLEQNNIPVEKYVGIRDSFVTNAAAQIQEVLADLAQAGKEQPDSVETILGGWDVNEAWRKMQQGESDLFYRISEYGYMVLTGNNEDEIRQGVRNYLSSLLRSATSFDLQTTLQTEKTLISAIRAKRDVIQKGQNLTLEEADEITNEICFETENSFDLYMENELGQHIRVNDIADYAASRAEFGGTERKKNLLLMNKGLVGLGMCLLLDEDNRLIFQPEGFAGQLEDKVTAQHYVRAQNISQLIDKLTEYEFIGSEKDLANCKTAEDYRRLFKRKDNTPGELVNEARKKYEDLLKTYEDNKNQIPSIKPTFKDLKDIQLVREELTKATNNYLAARREAKDAMDKAIWAFNVNGESADLGPPSIIAENGDFVNYREAVLFYKSAVMEAARKHDEIEVNGKKYYLSDTMASMSWRAYQWLNTRKWIPEEKWNGHKDNKENTADRRTFNVKTKGPNGQEITVRYKLKEGWEDMGLTEKEWGVFQEAVRAVKKDGYNAKIDIGGKELKFEEATGRNDVQPVLNNFTAVYKSSKDLINNPTAIREARKGNDPWLMDMIDRLEATGAIHFNARGGIKGGDQQRMNQFVDAITASTFFHWTMNGLGHWEATREKPGIEDDFDNSKYASDNLFFGYQGLNWGEKRMQEVRMFMFTNENMEIARAVNIVPFMPVDKTSLAKEMNFRNLIDLILNLNKEGIDNWVLMTDAYRKKDIWFMKAAAEGSIDDREMKKNHGWLEKPREDDDAVWTAYKQLPSKPEVILGALDKDNGIAAIQMATREDLVQLQIDRYGRFRPSDTATEATVAYHRGALGSGIGRLIAMRWFNRFDIWEDQEPLKGITVSRREETGVQAYEENVPVHKIFNHRNSYRPGVSIKQRAFSKFTASHNPGGILSKTPQPLLVVIS